MEDLILELKLGAFVSWWSVNPDALREDMRVCSRRKLAKDVRGRAPRKRICYPR